MSRRLLIAGPPLLLLLGLSVRHAPETPFNPLISAALIVLLALPSYYHLARSRDLVHAVILIAGLSLISMGVEAIGVMTGVPYGSFHYAASIVFVAAALFHVIYHGLRGDRGMVPRKGDLRTSIEVMKSFFGKGSVKKSGAPGDRILKEVPRKVGRSIGT